MQPITLLWHLAFSEPLWSRGTDRTTEARKPFCLGPSPRCPGYCDLRPFIPKFPGLPVWGLHRRPPSRCSLYPERPCPHPKGRSGRTPASGPISFSRHSSPTLPLPQFLQQLNGCNVQFTQRAVIPIRTVFGPAPGSTHSISTGLGLAGSPSRSTGSSLSTIPGWICLEKKSELQTPVGWRWEILR